MTLSKQDWSRSGTMRKYTQNKIMDTALELKKELQELEQKTEPTEADKKRMFDIKDWLYQLENALRGSWR